MPSSEQIDPNLKDATGSNNDLGVRGRRGNWLYFDASLFVLRYNNRIGRITRINDQGSAVTVKTNAGNSVSTGIEGILDIDWVKNKNPAPIGDCQFTFLTPSRMQNTEIITLPQKHFGKI